MRFYSHNAKGSLAQWQSRLSRRFSPSLWLCRTDGLELLSERGASSQWVLSRALCAYFLVDCADIPSGKRKQFVSTTVARRAPFADPGYHAEFAGTRAMVWMWSRQQVDEAAGPGVPKPRAVIPETLHRGAPLEGRVAELVVLSEGFEGRVWHQGLLAASEWWPDTPSDRAWAGFIRGAGLPAAPAPAPADHPLSETAWAASGQSVSWNEITHRYRTPIVAGAACTLAAVLAFPLGSVVRLKAQESAVDRTIESLDEGLQRIVAARESAEQDSRVVETLLGLRPPASQLDLLAAVARATPGADWQLLEWRLQDPRTLEVVLGVTNPDPEAVVAAWEADGSFSQVTAELGRSPGELTMRATLGPPQR